VALRRYTAPSESAACGKAFIAPAAALPISGDLHETGQRLRVRNTSRDEIASVETALAPARGSRRYGNEHFVRLHECGEAVCECSRHVATPALQCEHSAS
jgi:hypothetical protein